MCLRYLLKGNSYISVLLSRIFKWNLGQQREIGHGGAFSLRELFVGPQVLFKGSKYFMVFLSLIGLSFFPPLAQRKLWKLIQTYCRYFIQLLRIQIRNGNELSVYFSRVTYLSLSQGYCRQRLSQTGLQCIIGMNAVIGDTDKLH